MQINKLAKVYIVAAKLNYAGVRKTSAQPEASAGYELIVGMGRSSLLEWGYNSPVPLSAVMDTAATLVCWLESYKTTLLCLLWPMRCKKCVRRSFQW